MTLEELKEVHEHTCSLNNNIGTIGGRFTYAFTPTGLGEVFEVSCACGWKKDFTKYEEW